MDADDSTKDDPNDPIWKEFVEAVPAMLAIPQYSNEFFLRARAILIDPNPTYKSNPTRKQKALNFLKNKYYYYYKGELAKVDVEKDDVRASTPGEFSTVPVVRPGR